MRAVLPAVAAATDGRLLVGNNRGRVVHLADRKAGLTATGRLRRGAAPLCGQRARAWRAWPIDGRLLCRRCARRSSDFAFVTLPRADRAALIAQTVRTARDEPTWLAARHYALDITSLVVDGSRLGDLLAAARSRLNAEPRRRVRLERAVPRRLPAPRVRGRRPDPVDLLFGGTR